MDHESKVIILAINGCPGRQIVRVMGPVYGTGVRSRNIVGNFLGGVRAIFGGKQ
ncbi:YbjQ family protein [Acidithiobacillus ferrooxidans]|uniref:heavy metal-binding domain-containing protein n=1 Tax=Acidithiobacillus ferridurans TaxID=1232575 RepID=UPI001D00D3C7|nr:heavy metal-binding domain-containing protein [Acidithiobacillus ferridurans]MBU2804210.1 YbjQ family protein [Acidithiobacillus ferridurans]MBU2824069.1 YbjQ family protein [Acidithiobacillus ferrooxidans]